MDEETITTTATTQTGEGQSSGDQGQAVASEAANETTFTQADLDRVAGKVRKEALAQFAKEQGLGDLKALEGLIKAKKEAEEKSKSDLDKAIEKAAQAEARAQQLEVQMYANLLRAEFRIQAAEKVSDVDLAFLAADNMGLLNGDGPIEVDVATGRVTGVEKVVEKLIKEKPILKKAAKAEAAGTGGSEGGNTTKTGPSEAALRARFGI